MSEETTNCDEVRVELLQVRNSMIEAAISLVAELQGAEHRDRLVQLQRDTSEVWRTRLYAPDSVDAYKHYRNLDFIYEPLYEHLRDCLACRRWAYLVVECADAHAQMKEVSFRNRADAEPQSIEDVESIPNFPDTWFWYLSPIVASHVSQCPVCQDFIGSTQPDLGPAYTRFGRLSE